MNTEFAPQRNGRVVWGTIALLLAGYLFWQILGFHQADTTNPILGGLYFVLFGIHEVSHMVFGFGPQLLAAAAGSLSEIIFTSLVVVAACKYGGRWTVVFGLLWVMLAMASAGNYMADAADQLMPLVGMVPDPVHDWNFVFSELGWLGASVAIGTTVKVIGWLVGVAGLVLGAWLAYGSDE